jgi:hypothetical protein
MAKVSFAASQIPVRRVMSVAVNGTTLLNSVSYEPLGPVSGWTWATARREHRTMEPVVSEPQIGRKQHRP